MGKHTYKAPPSAAPWERQTGEGPAAWAAFQAFRDLGAGRSIRQTAEAMGKSAAHLEAYSARNNWQTRAAAWDAELDRIARADNIKVIRTMRKRHAELAEDVLAKAATALKKIPPDKITAADVCRMIEVGSKLERLARGDAGEVVENREGEALDNVVFYFPRNGRDD